MNIFAEKLKRDDLYLGAVEALKRADGNVERAVALLREAVVLAARDMSFGRKSDGGHMQKAQLGPEWFAPDNSSRGAGQEALASGHFSNAPPRDEATRRRAALIVAAVTGNAFDSFRDKYGVDLRKVQRHELPKLALKHRNLARVCAAIQRHSPNGDPFDYVPDMIKVADLEMFTRQVEANNEPDH